MQRLSQGHDLHCNCEDDDSSSESHQAHHPHHYHTQTCFPSRPGFLWKVIFLDKVSTTVSAFELVFFFLFLKLYNCCYFCPLNIFWSKIWKKYTHSPFCSILGVEVRQRPGVQAAWPCKSSYCLWTDWVPNSLESSDHTFLAPHMLLCMTVLSSIPFFFQPHILNSRT